MLFVVANYSTGKSGFSVEFHERNQRDSGLCSWWSRVPPRINSSERGKAVFVDGLLSLDGIPIGVEGRGAFAKREGREVIAARGTHRKGLVKMCKYHVLSGAYVFGMLLIGGFWQGIWPL